MIRISNVSPDSILGVRYAAGAIRREDVGPYLISQLSHRQTISAICIYVDRLGIVGQFGADAVAFAETQNDVSTAEDSLDYNEFIAELAAIDESWDLEDISSPANSIIQSLISDGLTRKKARQFVESFLTEPQQLEAVTQYIVANDLEEIYDDVETIYCYQTGTSLLLLRRAGVSMAEMRLITLDFVSSECDDSVLFVLCNQIESDGDAESIRSAMEQYLANGISVEAHAFLEQRERMTSKAYYSAYDTDPDISPSPEMRTPSVSLPQSIGGRSAFDSLQLIGGTGLLSEAAQRGVAVGVIDHGWRDRLPVVLCMYIDRVGRQTEFGRFVYACIEHEASSGANGVGIAT
jgi:hypothetical protein